MSRLQRITATPSLTARGLRCLIPLAAMLVAAGDPLPDDSIQSHDLRLVGTWQVIGVENASGNLGFFRELKMTITFSPTCMVIRYQDKKYEAAYTASPAVTPCWIDLEGPCLGIYVFEGKKLKMFIPNRSTRPANFQDYRGTKDGTFVLERQK